MARSSTRFWALVIGHAFLSAATFLFAKVAAMQLPVLALGFFRFAAAGIAFAGIAWGLRLELGRAFRADRGVVFWAAFFGVLVNQVAFLWGLKYTLPSHGALMYALTPILVLLLGWLRGEERPSFRKLAGLALAFSGVGALFSGGLAGDALPAKWMLGDLMIFSAVCCWAGYTVLSRPLVMRHGATLATGLTTLAGAALFIPVGALGIPFIPWRSVTPMAWVGVAYLGFVSSVVSYWLWSRALSMREASRVAVSGNLQPVLTALLAWGALGQPVTAGFALGTVLVIGGVVLAQR